MGWTRWVVMPEEEGVGDDEYGTSVGVVRGWCGSERGLGKTTRKMSGGVGRRWGGRSWRVSQSRVRV